MNIIKDKINQALNRITYSRNEWQFCISILREKEKCDKLEKINDFSPCFYTENQYTLDNLYFIILRMVIIDVYTLIRENEKNSYKKIINSIRQLNGRTCGIEKYDDMIEYIERFELEMMDFEDIGNRVEIIRNVFVAHTDGETKRLKYDDVEINIHELEQLIKSIFAFLFNVKDYLNNQTESSIEYLFQSGHIGNGSNNSFEKISRFYKKL